jgi:hypothetical protein
MINPFQPGARHPAAPYWTPVAAHQPEAPGCLDLPPLATPNDARNRVNEAMNPISRGFLLKRTCATALAMLAGMMWVVVASAVAQPVLSSGPTESRADGRQRNFATNDFVRSVRVSSNLPPFRLVLKPDTRSDEGHPGTDAIIGQIEIFRDHSPELWQRLLVPGIHSRWLTNSFHSVDINMDGYRDIAVLYEVAAKWGCHSYWLFEPASGRFATNALTADLREVRHNGLTFDPAKKELRASLFIGVCLNSFERYRIEHGRLVLQESERHEPRAPGRCLVTIRKRVNGELVLIESSEREHEIPPGW